MQRYKRGRLALLAPLTLLALGIMAGCSGGSGGSATAGSRSAALNVYVTDGFSDRYKQVLATLYKIEVSTDGTTYQTVYSDDSGHTVDLTALSTNAELLASLNVPTGTYTNARVTFGDHITLVAQDGTSSSVAVDSSIGTQADSKVTVTVTTPTKVLAGQTSTLVIDFKLAEFQLVGKNVRPKNRRRRCRKVRRQAGNRSCQRNHRQSDGNGF